MSLTTLNVISTKTSARRIKPANTAPKGNAASSTRPKRTRSASSAAPSTENRVSLSDLIPDARNANRGTDRGRSAVRKSLQDLGAGRSIVLDKHGRIIAGNKTARKLL